MYSLVTGKYTTLFSTYLRISKRVVQCVSWQHSRVLVYEVQCQLYSGNGVGTVESTAKRHNQGDKQWLCGRIFFHGRIDLNIGERARLKREKQKQ